MPVKGVLTVAPRFRAVQQVEAAATTQAEAAGAGQGMAWGEGIKELSFRIPQAEAVGVDRGVGARGDGIKELSFRLTWEGMYRVGGSEAVGLGNSHGVRAM